MAALGPLGCGGRTAGESGVVLAAATSLRGVLPRLVESYERRPGAVRIAVPSYSASGILARQVEGGAPVDAILSANALHVDRLIQGGYVESGSRVVFAHNTLVLIGPTGGPTTTVATLPELPADRRVVIGEPSSVPAGRYAQQLFDVLGIWDDLQSRLVFGSNVAQVLAWVQRGEVAAGVVYRTEIRGVDDVVLLEEVKGPDAPRPEYVAAVVRDAPGARGARAFLEFVVSPEGQLILGEFGFSPAQP